MIKQCILAGVDGFALFAKSTRPAWQLELLIPPRAMRLRVCEPIIDCRKPRECFGAFFCKAYVRLKVVVKLI